MNASVDKRIKLSIVIAAWNGAEMLRACLLSLKNQVDAASAEVVVVMNFGDEEVDGAPVLPFARRFVLPADTTVPELRTRGILESKGEIVALSEDLCVFESNWCREILKAHADPSRTVVGGAVDNVENQSALDWAIYFFDYGKYMPPNLPQTMAALSEVNISYKRGILEQKKENYADGFLETFFNKDLKSSGYKLYLQPSAIVFHRKNYQFKKISSQFYHQARSFAARRSESFKFDKRLTFVAAAPFLPILLSFRIIKQIIRKKRRLGKLTRSLPYLIVLASVWAFGELCGLLGGAGKSKSQ